MPSLLYFCQDGISPSGVATYGYAVLRYFPDARMLLLNTAAPPAFLPPDVSGRIHVVPEEESHDVEVISRHLRALVATSSDGVAILPNTGDTCWSATVDLVRTLAPPAREPLRVLGIVHSDVETQYVGAVRHASFASAWIGVSRRCVEVLKTRLPETIAPAVSYLPYPMFVPSVSAPWPRRDAGPLRLAYVGRLEEPQKRVSRLAAVLKALARRGLSFTATIVGDGPARSELVAAVPSNQMGSQIVFTGAVGADRIAAVLERSDVFLLTSAFEGLPLALLEAMAAGVCPVVMAVESGLPELVQDGANARVVPQGDVEAMAQVIQELSMDRRQVERLGQAARNTVREKFSPEAHFKKLAEIIDELWALPPPDPGLVAPDPTALAVARLVEGARTSGGAVAIYGAGMFGRKVVDACLDAAIPVSAWFDSDPARGGLVYRGLTCLGPPEIPRHAGATFLVGSLEFATEIAERIRSAARVAGARMPRIVIARDGSQVRGST